ncbi:sigma-70 family RNA polymerase sigma factor [Nonomuraea gerenzanensis]|uniref:sigma-70 family RNA polymerase sigma factor n=1 Tax=Nonomuraea gerenzanensis TaxID=93944 RepID=UPI001CD9D98E|nr:sigma-70 family RNA polymerase sigma factor [Nonomuraea gerenzanensis]UBU10213.1 sigma-70 family RNA polymerase sigma factor [Nonomuraea gerenzanensis]
MDTADDFLAGRFEEHRAHLKAVAYRMLGSLAEADDAVQEAWLRLSRAGGDEIGNLGGWLTTVVGRVCLDMLRSRTARREDPLEQRLPDPVVTPEGGGDPEQEAMIADSVGLALLVVLESLSPAERLAFVLHDMFAVPFEQIAVIVDRTPVAAKKLASRARQRVRGTVPPAEPDPGRRRKVVEAFLAAARGGDFEALLAILDPDVVMRVDTGGGLWTISGASAVAGQASGFQRFTTSHVVEAVLVNGVIGLVGMENGRPRSVMSFTITDGRIAALDLLSDPPRVAALRLTTPGEPL